MNYWPCYAGDYMRDTADLSLGEHGAFFLLMCFAYSTEKPLPASVDRLCRMVRATTEDERSAVRSVAEQFFPVCGDGLRHNERVDREIVISRQKRDTARTNGRKGGRPKTASKPTGSESETHTEPPEQSDQGAARAASATDTETSPAPTPSPSPTPSPPPSTAVALAPSGEISPGSASALYPQSHRENAQKDSRNDRPMHVGEVIPADLVDHVGAAT